MKKLIILVVLVCYTMILKSQVIFEFDVIEHTVDSKTDKQEIYGKITIDSDTIKMVTEYNGFVFNDIISNSFFITNHNTKITEYCYYLNQKELLHIFKYDGKIYSVVISSIINHKNYTTFSKKYL